MTLKIIGKLAFLLPVRQSVMHHHAMPLMNASG
jgi:hypothetical protein